MYKRKGTKQMFKKQGQKGFTIIEVLIVLAIAGLIMLIVFLAVPSLQRNARNNARRSDASILAASVSECVANNNGVIANCQVVSTTAAPNGVSYSSTGREITTVAYGTTATSSLTAARWVFGQKCNGASTTTGGQREFTVEYLTEGGNGSPPACISS